MERAPRARGLLRAATGGLSGAFLALFLAGAAPADTAPSAEAPRAVTATSDAPVADAAERDDAGMVRTLIETGADVNAGQGDGMTALHWAARNRNAQLVDLLLDAGAELEATTRLGAYTPLHMAARTGAVAVVRRLLEAGAQADVESTIGGVTPLHFAAEAGAAEAIDALVEAGAAVDAVEEKWGQTPLVFAASYNRLEAVKALLAHGADPNHETTVVDVVERFEEHRRGRALRERRLAAIRAGVDPDMAEEEARKEESEEERAEREAALEARRPVEEPEPLSYAALVGGHGGLTPLLHAAREGHAGVVRALLEGGADIDRPSGGDGTTPILMATINGHFDLALELLERGADPNLGSDAGNQPLYAAINTHWAPKSRYPQQHAYKQQETTHLELMEALLEAGADPNARLDKHLWFMSYNFDLLRVDTRGATPFWRAAYGLDIPAMKLLLAYGADSGIPTEKVPQRRYRRSDTEEEETDPSGLPPVPVGGPAVYPIHAASGVGYGQGFAANAHRHVHNGWLPAMRFLVEELGADVNARDHNGYTALHHAASRGDNEMILYLVEQGADVTAVSRAGQTTADMANGPYQRTQPYPETVELLERLGSENNHNCVSC
jgi:ankyrin repeat protein